MIRHTVIANHYEEPKDLPSFPKFFGERMSSKLCFATFPDPSFDEAKGVLSFNLCTPPCDGGSWPCEWINSMISLTVGH